ncbi:ADAMTS-like protein 1 [Folsomia candida]|uniref:ADAMTS-like protein 1 n=1 Tax=Folsomia candida TaxID=158441 RepID=A0A226F1U7_FOLCA|nr:ADAMTS-like protein 1 [Folsomia candida]
MQSCNIQPCEPQWETGEWSVCSTTCGGGLKIRKVFCAQEKNGTKIQVAEKLCHHIRRSNNQEPCNPHPCPNWHAGPWSSCSVTCGNGYMTRNVVCRDSANLPSSNCDARLKPGVSKSCAEEECSLPATPTAQVIHRSPTKKRRGKTTPASSYAARILTTTSTTTTEEIPAEYQAPDIDNDIYVEEGIPREHTLPLIQPYPPMDNAMLFDNNALPSEPTNVRVYFSCGWLFQSFVAGEWSPCSSTCGEGSRTREVKCKIFLEFSRTIANLPDKECPGPKPSESEPCFSSPCHLGDMGIERLSDVHQAALADSEASGGNIRKTLSVGLPPGMAMQDMTFSWKVLGYTPCSTSCLGGIQEAMIQCVRDYDQRIATPVLCMDKPQPDIATTRTCNDHPCPPRWNVTEFGPCSKPCGGGVMTREVSCIHEVTRGNTVIVPNNICPSAIPRTERLCNTVNCPPYWEPGEWGKCSKPCGGGLRTRIIHCKQISALGQIVELSNGDLHCNSPKPGETKSCNKKSCSKMSRPASTGHGGGPAEEPEYKEKVTLGVKGRGTVYAGVVLRLRCPSGKGMDKGSLIWMKGHEYLKVQPDRMELIHKTGVLKITNTTYSDSGIYTCVCKLFLK